MRLMIESILKGLNKDCYETSKDNILSWARINHHLDKMFSFPLHEIDDREYSLFFYIYILSYYNREF
jgi:hypothetical protein